MTSCIISVELLISELTVCNILLTATVTLNKEESVNNDIINSQTHRAVNSVLAFDEESCSCHDEIEVKASKIYPNDD